VHRRPARDPFAEGARLAQDLVCPPVAGEHRRQDASCLVGLVDDERVVRHELGERVGDPLEERVDALLREDVVEHLGEPPVRIVTPVRAAGLGPGSASCGDGTESGRRSGPRPEEVVSCSLAFGPKHRLAPVRGAL